MSSKFKPILGISVLLGLTAVLFYVKPWQASGPTNVPTSQTQAPDPTQLATSPKSGKKHPLSDFKPVEDKPGWVICPDTNQQIPVVTLKR